MSRRNGMLSAFRRNFCKLQLTSLIEIDAFKYGDSEGIISIITTVT